MNKLFFLTHNVSAFLLRSVLCFLFQFSATATGILPVELHLPDDPFWQEDALEANHNEDHFKEPADDVNYADYHYVGAHNAHVYPRFFKVVRQQDQTTLGQLTYGIRGFMWDTYNFTLTKPAALRGPSNAKVCLSHPQPGFLAFTQKGHNSYQSFQYELRRLIEWMKLSPKAVITVILENYADMAQTVAEIEAVINAAQYDPILKPADWKNIQTYLDQQWPTLGWMREHNKRLIIFTQHGNNSKYTWPQFMYCIENQYSTTDEQKLCSQRAESHSSDNLKRKLVIMNNFSSLAVTRAAKDAQSQVSYDTVKRVVMQCEQKNFAHKRLFNGYFADRIIDACNELYKNNKKTVFDYVNELNQKVDRSYE